MKDILIIDKPQGMTSHDVVDAVRRKFNIRKVGHCGTLDPMATGVLVILMNQATRLSARLCCDEKEYICRMTLGCATDTHDGTGNVTRALGTKGMTAQLVRDTIMSFKGRQKQIPPMISAKYHKGERLYKLARKGVVVDRQPVDIDIKDIDIISVGQDNAEFRVTCSKGTYIRTLCHDIGKRLGCGAYMDSLRRIRSGQFHIKDAFTLEAIQ
ncbi:MAG: tRNA pseudouridine(55) synthase TruB [Candidatus Omnitrophota bacterium]|jgi:tRNA pseudouridine55 synthase